MGLVALESEIPPSHPEKEAIEAAVHGVFMGDAGAWQAGILLLPNAPCWIVFVQEPRRRFRRSALLAPGHQCPEVVGGIVEDLKHERRRFPRPANA